jgi:hypothetical protein
MKYKKERKNIVAYRPVVGNDREKTRQQWLLGSYRCATMEVVLKAVFSMWSSPKVYDTTDRVQLS